MRQVVHLAVLVVAGLGVGGAIAESDQASFYRAYYLEHAEHKHAEAEKIYTRLVRETNGELRRAARVRRDTLREDRLSSDLSRLMPQNALAYVELNQPGGQMERLLGQLGLMASDGQVREPGQLAISPSIIRTLAGLRGVAAAITGFDPANEVPTGVLVMHPGDLEVVRGLLETALPVAAEPAGEIEGFATYTIEDEVFVTLTRKLVVVSPQRHEIAGVLERLSDPDMGSLAESEHMQPLLEKRQGGLVYFAVSFEPIMPLLEAAMNGGAAASEEVAIIKTLFDPQSLRSLVGEVGVADDGLFLDLQLDLDGAHRNLVFNFLQLPPLDRATLERIPSGSAAFFVGALNPRQTDDSTRPEIDQPLPVSGMDIGREVFGNIIGLAAFVMPPGGPVMGEREIPDAGLILTVNDPARSHALWSTLLGVASLAANEGRAQTETVTIDGLRVKRYGIDEVELYLATTGTDVIVAPSRTAISAALRTRSGDDSLLNDRAFGSITKSWTDDTTIAIGMHPGRCLQVASQFMDDDEREEMAPIREMLQDTVAGVALTHGRDSFRLLARVVELPNVGGLVSKLIAEEKGGYARHDRRVYRSERVADRKDERRPESASELNNRAWALLTEGSPSPEEISVARKLSQRSNEMTDYQEWAFLDTLALAEFRSGNVDEAIRLQRQAIEHAASDDARKQARESLERFLAKQN